MENLRTITTKPCQVSPQRYFNLLLRYWLRRNWIWVALPLVLLIALAIYNTLFIYVGLIIIFLVLPPLFMFLWFSYILHPDCRTSILTKRVELNNRGIICAFEDERTQEIKWSDIENVHCTSREIVFHLSRYMFFVLPGDAFENPDDLEYFLKKIWATYNHQKK